MKKILAFVLALTLLATLPVVSFAQEPTELNFYFMSGPITDLDRIMEKANVIIEKEIGARLNLIPVDGSTYADKMNLMISSGDAWDLCFTAHWGGLNFFSNAAKGAYADLTDLIPQYAPQTYARIPEGLWDGVKVDGRIYGLVNYQQWGSASRSGFKFRSDIAEEVGFDWKAVKGKDTITALNMTGEFLGKALEKHPDMIGWETSTLYSLFANSPLYWDMEAVGDTALPGWIDLNNPDVVINQFDSDLFMQYCNIMRDWYNKGYVRKDGATVKDTSPDRKACKFIAEAATGWPDSIDFQGNADAEKMSMTTHELAPAVLVSTTRTLLPSNAGANAAVAINAESKNIEKSLQLMELLNTNDELFMLITNGEEGVDFNYDETGKKVDVAGKFHFGYNEWQVGQSYSPTFSRAAYDRNESGKLQQDAQSVVFAAETTADVSPLSGFVFDPAPVKTEIANCSAVITELIPALSAGSVDPAVVVPELRERLNTAGVAEIIAQKQAQYDAWRAAK